MIYVIIILLFVIIMGAFYPYSKPCKRCSGWGFIEVNVMGTDIEELPCPDCSTLHEYLNPDIDTHINKSEES